MFLVLVLCNIAFVLSSKVLEATYRIEQGFVHDLYLKAATIELELDEDLYVAPLPRTCPHVKSPPVEVTCYASCDYTVADDTCNKPSDRLKHLGNYTTECDCGKPSYCDTSKVGWTVLEPGKTISVVQTTRMAFYRFYADHLDGYLLHWELEDLRVVESEVAQFYLGPDHISAIGWNIDPENNFYGITSYYSTNNQGHQVIEMCPGDQYYPIGTTFMGISCYQHEICRYNLTLEKTNSDGYDPPGTQPTKCTAAKSTLHPRHICLEDGMVHIEDYKNRTLPDEVWAPYAIHYYTFLADPQACPYVVSASVPRSNFLFVALTLSWDNPYPKPNDPNTHFYTTKTILGWSGPVAFSFPCDYPRVMYISVQSYVIFWPMGAYRIGIQSLHPPDLSDVADLVNPIFASQLMAQSVELRCQLPPNTSEVINPGVAIPNTTLTRIRQCAGEYMYTWIVDSSPCALWFRSIQPTEEGAYKFYPWGDYTYYLWDKFPRERFITKKKVYQAVLVLQTDGVDGHIVNMDERFLNNCTVHFNGQLMDKNYNPVGPSGVKLVPAKTQCNTSTMRAAKELLHFQIQRLEEATTTSQTAVELYLSSVLWFHPAIQACVSFAVGVSNITIMETNVTTDICFNYDPQDVCCNIDLKATHCCQPRQQQQLFQSLSLFQEYEGCSDKTCANLLLDQFGSSLLQTRCPLALPIRAYVEKIGFFWTQCVKQVWGSTDLRYGGQCWDDTDCPGNYTCDTLAYKCLGPGNLGYDYEFLECFVSKAPLNLLSRIIMDTRILDDKQKMIDFLVQNFTRKSCSHDHTFDLASMDHYRLLMTCPDFECGDQYSASSSIYRSWIGKLPIQSYACGFHCMCFFL
eukprot:TRINITY_DN4641_c0_g1_i5.p1 TRINITY_DN4641_c0_g1~~TRINITY_DN4641_c0_g1_i5.p1  ORF type:complete len:856 (+),score=146.03 TRINITY_DN4641_c0_g1_i5:189-2756(+)